MANAPAPGWLSMLEKEKMDRVPAAAARWRRALGRGLVPVLVLAPLLAAAAWICADAFGLEITTPVQLNYVEGFNVDDAVRVVRGEPLYADPSHPPFVMSVYTPGYTLVLAALIAAGVPALATGRLLASLSTLGIAAVIAAAGVRRTGWVALAAAALFLVQPMLPFWQVVARPDATAGLLAIAAVVALESSTSRRRDLLAAAALAGSFLTKQSFVAAPLAALLFLAQRDRKRAGVFAAALAVMCAGPVLALQLASHGRFLWDTVVGNANAFSWGRVWVLGGEFWSHHLLAAVLLLALFPAGWRSRPRSLTALWAALAAIGDTLMLGKAGSDLNYLLEASAAIALLAARELPRAWLSRPGLLRTTCAAVLAVVASGAGVAAAAAAARARGPLADVRGLYGELVQRVAREPGVVVSDDACLLVAARRPVYLQPFVMAQLARAGRWDQRPFLRQLRDGKVRLLIVQVGPSAAFASRYTPEMRRLLAERYVVVARYQLAGEYAILAPAPGPETHRRTPPGSARRDRPQPPGPASPSDSMWKRRRTWCSTGASMTPARTRKTTPANRAYRPASHFPAVVCSGSTGPMPPSSIAALRNESDHASPSTQW